MSMQSEQMRQRKRERKRLEREEMRRSRQPSLPVGIAVSVGWRRRVVPDDEAQMCAPRGEFDLLLPRRTAALFRAAMQKARKEAGRQLLPGECLARIAKNFVDTWGPILRAEATQELARRTLPEPVPSPSSWTAGAWRWKEGGSG
jgi:hypothetical protein